MAVGVLVIDGGLIFYGPKLIRTVGSEITELDQISIIHCYWQLQTVIIASQLGLPVSSNSYCSWWGIWLDFYGIFRCK